MLFNPQNRKAFTMTNKNSLASSINDQTSPPITEVRNIVLVHGALADASGFRAVYDILKRQGCQVSLTSQPLTSRAADIADHQHLNIELTAFVFHPHTVSRMHLARSLRLLSVRFNPAQFAGSRRQGARLEESGSPKPLIDSYAIHIEREKTRVGKK